MKIKTIAIIIIIGLGGFALGRFAHIPLSHGGDGGAAHKVADKILYWTCGMHPQIMEDKPGTCPICGMNLTPYRDNSGDDEEKNSGDRGKILYWVAPMDPSYVRDEPGKSPMGMDLVPVYENDVAGGGTVSIDPSVVQNMGVRTGVVERTSLSRVIRTVGHVDYDETRLTIVNTKISGWIEKVYTQETGAYVEKGQPLYEIYSPELVAAQEEYILSIESGSKKIRDASRKRLKFWDIPDSEIAALEKSRQVSKTITFNAPDSGYLMQMNAIEGKSVNKGTDLFKIADLSTVWVYAHIYENEASFVKKGMAARMNLSYLPGKKYEGVVDYVYPYIDEKTRDIKVRIIFTNPELDLKPQMYANVIIESKISDDALVVPSEAIVRTGERSIVFVAKDAGKFQPREIQTGVEDDKGRTQVISGLANKEVVVISGQFLLDSESKLREAIEKMMSKSKGSTDSAGAVNPDSGDGGAMEMGGESMNEEPASVSAWPDPSKGKYVCPMETDDFYSDAPGDCPKCGMKLVDSQELHDELNGAHAH